MIRTTFLIATIFFFVLTNFVQAKEPAWIHNPSLGSQYKAAIGCAKKQKNKEIQKRIAIMNAKAELANQKDLYVEDAAMLTMDDFSVNLESLGTQQSNALGYAVVKDTYMYEDGLLCVWMVEENNLSK